MKKRIISGALAIPTVLLSAACASSPPPIAKAATVEQAQCDGSTPSAEETKILQSSEVLNVKAVYSPVPTKDDEDHIASGATLLVRPPDNVNAERMTRILQCHGARVLLGQANGNAVPHDPYWLPHGWVDVKVKPEKGNFAVTVSSNSIHRNLQIYARASHYADGHMLAAVPLSPP